MKTMNVSEFKTKCLAVVEEIHRTGEGLTLLKRGRPIVLVVRPEAPKGKYPQDEIRGKGRIVGDITGPVLPPDTWNANRGIL